jgi:hypothetical protein
MEVRVGADKQLSVAANGCPMGNGTPQLSVISEGTVPVIIGGVLSIILMI